jgi:hypothetical protein
MRDLVIFAVTAIGLLYTLRRPWIGVLLYAWFAYMNPHRLSYGRATRQHSADSVRRLDDRHILCRPEPRDCLGPMA